MKEKIKRVLIVDDQIELALAIKMHLKRNFFEADIAVNGLHAFQNSFSESSITSSPFELVILDYYMPMMDGPAFYLKLIKEFPDISVLFYSGMISKESMMEMIRPDMDACCSKPLTPHKMLSLIKLIDLKRQKKVRELQTEIYK